jgi:hypothetical protein
MQRGWSQEEAISNYNNAGCDMWGVFCPNLFDPTNPFGYALPYVDGVSGPPLPNPDAMRWDMCMSDPACNGQNALAQKGTEPVIIESVDGDGPLPIYVLAARNNSPRQGEPNSTVTYPNGKGGSTTRTFNSDGNAHTDIDIGHPHGDVGDPHQHIWENGVRGPGIPIPTDSNNQSRSIGDWISDHRGAIITGAIVVGVGTVIILSGGSAAPLALAVAF